MSRYWTSPRTGTTYDTSRTDAFGNWAVVGGASVAPMLGGAALIMGTIGVAAAWIGAVVLALPFLIGLFFARWPFTPVLLFVVALLLLVLPQGRRRLLAVFGAAGLSFLMIPGSILSMWSLGNVGGGGYAWIASFPLVTIVSLSFTVWAAVKRLWPAAALYALVGIVSGLINLVSWISSMTVMEGLQRQPPAVLYGLDNVLATGALVVLTLIVSVIAAQIADSVRKRRATTGMQGIDGDSNGNSYFQRPGTGPGAGSFPQY